MRINHSQIDKVIGEVLKLEYERIVDSHCHIESDAYTDSERIYAIELSIKRRIIMISSPLTDDERYIALDLSRKFEKWIFITIGSHPLYNEPVDRVINFIKQYEREIVGVGEVGLDFSPPNNSDEIRMQQIKKFELFINIAKELDKPLVVHSRSAGKYAIDILLRNGAERVLMHSFSGKAKYAKKGIEAGYYFSIPPTIAYSPQKQKLAKVLPLEYMMLESDAPALSPKRGRLSYPWNILFSAAVISIIKDIDIMDVIKVTTRNAINLFRLRV